MCPPFRQTQSCTEWGESLLLTSFPKVPLLLLPLQLESRILESRHRLTFLNPQVIDKPSTESLGGLQAFSPNFLRHHSAAQGIETSKLLAVPVISPW